MTTDFEKVAAINEILEKQAILGSIVGAAARGVGGAAMTAVRNPAMAFNAMDVSGSAIRASKEVGDSRIEAAANIPNVSGPTF